MSQVYFYPPGFAVSTDPSVGNNGSPIPTESNLVGAEDPSGDLQPLQVDGSGNLLVSIGAGIANPLPVADAAAEASLASIDTKLSSQATAANQATQITSLNDLNARTAGALVPVAFDEIDITYISSGSGTGQVGTAVYKLAGSTVKTLTLTYDISDRLSTVVAS